MELHIAAFNGDTERVKELLKQGFPADTKTPSGRTPLHIALRYRKFE